MAIGISRQKRQGESFPSEGLGHPEADAGAKSYDDADHFFH